jgi:hypothetical protein
MYILVSNAVIYVIKTKVKIIKLEKDKSLGIPGIQFVGTNDPFL